jgi:hypothetical protein
MIWAIYCFNVEEREEGKGRIGDGKGTREKGENEISL